MSTRLSTSLIILTGICLVNAVLRNITVDDAATSDVIPSYFPSPSDWMQGAECTYCRAHPDPLEAFGGTWHDTTGHPGDARARAIDFSFNGSAVYVFFILANTIGPGLVDTVTNMNFIIDGVLVGNFLHNPSTSTEFIYNVPVYINESLLSREHQFRMEATGNRLVLILFDYLIYTTDEAEPTPSISSPISVAPASASAFYSSSVFYSSSTFASASTSVPPASETPTKSSTSNMGAIIGGAVAGTLALSMLSSALLYWWHRKRVRTPSNAVITQGVNNDRSPLSGSTDRSVGIVPFTSGSKAMMEAPPAYSTMPFTSKTRASNKSTTSSITTSNTRSEMTSQNNHLTNDSETCGRSCTELSQVGTPPSTSTSTIVLTQDSRYPDPQHLDGGSTNETRILRGEVGRLMDEVARLRQLDQQ